MIHRKKSLLGIAALIGLLIVFTSSVYAETATLDEMTRVCRNWLALTVYNNGDWAGSDNPYIIDVHEIVQNDTLLARSFDIAPSGFIVVPILKELPPVKAFSVENNLDVDWENGFPDMLKTVLLHRVSTFARMYGSLEVSIQEKSRRLFGPGHRSEWDRFLQNESEFLADLSSKAYMPVEEIGPFLTTSWHQSEPYNDSCPDGDGGLCIVGCTATAAAQILAYHRWPDAGTGTSSYYWYGDQSCEGSTPGMTLTADYSDPYDWDNIPDDCESGCTPEQEAALAELCHEVGVAFHMAYGYCASGAYMEWGLDAFPDYFKYFDQVEEYEHSDYNMYQWSDLVREEMEAGRPAHYGIVDHSIVCDGWRRFEGIHQIHMNYGWGPYYNVWFTVDELLCDWEDCSPLYEYMISNIMPNRGVEFTSDTTWGHAPFTVNFEGSSTLEVDSWLWDFGEGGFSYEQSPSYEYTTPGRFDVSLQVTSGEQTPTFELTNYIITLADTLLTQDVVTNPGEIIEVEIYSHNTCPLNQMKIPVEFKGDLDLTLLSYSTEGYRTEQFDTLKVVHANPWGKQYAFSMHNTEMTAPYLEPGVGPAIKLTFQVPYGAQTGQKAVISTDGYGTHDPIFFWLVRDYVPVCMSSTVSLPFLCGDVDASSGIDLTDILELISYIYVDPLGEPIPRPEESGDVNNDGDKNLTDILTLISYVYVEPIGEPELICP